MHCYIAAYCHPTEGWLTKVGVSTHVKDRVRHIGCHYGYKGCKFVEVYVSDYMNRKKAFGMEGMILAKLHKFYTIIGEELVRCEPSVAVRLAEELTAWLNAELKNG